jgi:hypothetical protein
LKDLDARQREAWIRPARGGGWSQRGAVGRRLDPLKDWMRRASAMRRGRTAARST